MHSKEPSPWDSVWVIILYKANKFIELFLRLLFWKTDAAGRVFTLIFIQAKNMRDFFFFFKLNDIF